jgi:hypothetical protein
MSNGPTSDRSVFTPKDHRRNDCQCPGLLSPPWNRLEVLPTSIMPPKQLAYASCCRRLPPPRLLLLLLLMLLLRRRRHRRLLLP